MNNVLDDQRTLWAVAGISFLLFVIGNLPWQLDDYDQAKQAFTSFQIVNEGRWLYQQTPHEQVATKPPLVGWVSAGLFALTRSWDLAWRLPSLLAAIALAVFLFRNASSAYGRVPGVIALAAFAFNLLSLRLATLVRTDMPLAFVIFLIGLLIWKKIRTGMEWTAREQLYLFGLLTIAMLIKGPIVYAFLLPGIALNAVAVGLRATPARPTGTRLQPWSGWWPWVASLGVFLLWVIAGFLLQPGFFDQVVMREFIGRFGETIHRPQPLYFYLLHLLHKFAPWSVLIIAIAVVDLHSRKWRLRAALREMSPETFWLLCWSIGGLLVMSLIPSKRVDRIFPIVPPLCLLLAAQIAAPAAYSEEPVGRRLARKEAATITLALAILFTGGYALFKVVAGYRNHRDALVVFGREVRREAETHHWRYAVVSAKDEGLLLYLRKAHFIEPDRAVGEWNDGNLDALVASTDKASALMSQLRVASVSQLKSTERKKEDLTNYVLITR
jgi:4-amino-4-deoxy-L-arabinose transferase-like glycosyltransferase